MLKNAFISITLLALFGWAMVSMYDVQMQFAEIMKEPEPPWEITMDLLPTVVFVVIGGILSFIVYSRARKKGNSFLKAAFLPTEFEEGDEREAAITAKATRSSYISMWISAPILTAFLCVYPYVSEAIPYYPILIFLLLPIVQIVTYTVKL